MPASEGAGDVIAVGDGVTNVKVGDRVIVGGARRLRGRSAGRGNGRCARFRHGVDYATAAGFTAAYLTAYVGAGAPRARLRRARWLLVHGAAGGVGLAAVDLGKVLGAHVIATASTDEKRAFLKNYGADHVLPSSGFREEVKELTGGAARM